MHAIGLADMQRRILKTLVKPKFHLARHVTSRHDSARSTCRTSRARQVVSRRDVTSQVEFGLWDTLVHWNVRGATIKFTANTERVKKFTVETCGTHSCGRQYAQH